MRSYVTFFLALNFVFVSFNTPTEHLKSLASTFGEARSRMPRRRRVFSEALNLNEALAEYFLMRTLVISRAVERKKE